MAAVNGLRRAGSLTIPAPKLIASGIVDDKYSFSYMIMEYLNGIAFGNVEDALTYDEKVIVGQKLRVITDKLNTPCNDFDPVDILESARNNAGWSSYPDTFKSQRPTTISRGLVKALVD